MKRQEKSEIPRDIHANGEKLIFLFLISLRRPFFPRTKVSKQRSSSGMDFARNKKKKKKRTEKKETESQSANLKFQNSARSKQPFLPQQSKFSRMSQRKWNKLPASWRRRKKKKSFLAWNESLVILPLGEYANIRGFRNSRNFANCYWNYILCRNDLAMIFFFFFVRIVRIVHVVYLNVYILVKKF